LVVVAVKRVGAGIRFALRPMAGLVPGLVADLTRSRTELLADNALLRQQLIVLRRSTKRPEIRRHERGVMVVLAALTRTWRSALLLVRPETILRWHRAGFRLFWRSKSRKRHRSGRLCSATIALIQRMAIDNRLWGAERIRGELLKIGIRVSKRTVQKYMRHARGPQPWGQDWTTFLSNHASQIWACDFLQTYDIFFRAVFAYIIVELGSREVVHVAVTRAPTSGWTAQQLREATPFGEGPRFIIRDNDDKYGSEFDRVARMSGIRVLRTPVHAPTANAICERFLGSVRRECLDHIMVVGERHLQATLREYVVHFNTGRPHQGIGQRTPAGPATFPEEPANAELVAVPVLGGLHHEYRWAA
jgi:putative transposase